MEIGQGVLYYQALTDEDRAKPGKLVSIDGEAKALAEGWVILAPDELKDDELRRIEGTA